MKKANSILLGEIGHLIRIVQRGKGKVRNLLEGGCIPSRLGYQMGIGPSRLEFGFLYYPIRTYLILTHRVRLSHHC